jgi:hypothetical protein
LKHGIGAILGRLAAIIAGLLLLGIVLKLLVAVLAPILPAQLAQGLVAGWNLLYSIVSPAIGPIMAVGILLAICWVVVGLRK